MRIQLNQYLRDIPYEYYKYGPSRYVAKICDHCHTELLGKWVLPCRERYYSGKTTLYFDHNGFKVHVSYEDVINQNYTMLLFFDRSYELGVTSMTISPEEEREIRANFQRFFEEEKKSWKEYEDLANMDTCPVCHSKLNPTRITSDLPLRNSSWCASYCGIKYNDLEVFMKKNGISTEKDFQDESLAFEFLLSLQRESTMSVALSKLQNTIADLDQPLQALQPSTEVNTIKSSTEKLKEYIHTLFTLETNIYSIQKRLQTLYADQMDAICDSTCVESLRKKQIKEDAEQKQKEYQIQIAELEKLKNARPKVICLNKPTEPRKPEEPYYETPGFFNKKKVMLQNEARKAEYENEYRKYEAAMEEYRRKMLQVQKEETRLMLQEEEKCRQAILKANADQDKVKADLEQFNLETERQIAAIAQMPSSENAKKTMIEEEIAKAEDLLKRTLDCRNQLYAYDIVFGKYRNLVALATFYEYLISGRCTSLEGANGAYNIFEAECRANQIIGQLSKIIDSLEAIKESQYLVYTQLKSINSSLYGLQNSMDNMNKTLKSIDANTKDTNQYLERISKNSDVIAYNTAATAYYSQLNASLTNSLGYLIALH